MNVKFLDLQAQYSSIKLEIDAAIARVVNRQYFILGEELDNFENEFAKFLGCKYAVGVGSGTEGLILALRAVGVGQGDEVIVQANSFIASALAISQVGATPVFVDVDKDTYQIDVEAVKKKITKKTKAILPVHLYGAPCDIETLKKIAADKNIYLIEDSAQAHGAMVNKKYAGTFGEMGIFSFYPGKNLGAYGDGGCIVTNSKDLYEKLLLLRNYGQTKKYHHDTLGINSRLDEIQAAILRVKLSHLEIWNEQRNKVAALYRSYLPNQKMQEIIPSSYSNYHIFIIEHEKRDALQKYLLSKQIHTLIHYPLPIHLQKCYNYLGYKKGDFPIAEKLADTILSLPIFSELAEKEIAYVAQSIKSF